MGKIQGYYMQTKRFSMAQTVEPGATATCDFHE